MSAETGNSAPVVRLERDGDVAHVILANPPLNLFDRRLMEGLRAALDTLEREPPRAALLRAEGDVFSAGVDVEMFEGLTPENAQPFIAGTMTQLQRWESLPLPTLAVVHGLRLTTGFELALASDLIWAAQEASFGLVEAVIGITPLMGRTQRLAERAGAARARELVFTGGLYPAPKLTEWGVINAIFPADELVDRAKRFAARLAAGPTAAHAATKRVVAAAVREGVQVADERLSELAGGVFGTEDFASALRSFKEQGPGHASFTGR